MSDRLADVVAQVQNARQLGAIVAAMRGIAASRAQKARALLAGADAYSEVVSRAIGRALSLLPTDVEAPARARRGKLCLVLLGAEQGFAGAFTERILDAASPDLASAVALIVGTRGAAIATERGVKPAWQAPMAAHVDATPALADRVADALFDAIAVAGVSRVDVIFCRAATGAGIVVERRSLLPIDFSRFARPPKAEAPLLTLSPQVLLERLVAEYVYAQICQAVMHAFEAENEARMRAMTSTKTTIEKRLASLTQRERRLRQAEITAEIIELSAGAEAINASREGQDVT
jgi:F-type H+-transporting ATPase subunit gamma